MKFTFEDFVLLSSLGKSDFKVKNQEENTAKAAETYFYVYTAALKQFRSGGLIRPTNSKHCVIVCVCVCLVSDESNLYPTLCFDTRRVLAVKFYERS